MNAMKNDFQQLVTYLTRLVLVGLTLGGVALAQGKPRVSVQLSSGVARLGEDLSLQLSVEDAGRARIVSVPEVEGLTFGAPRGPATESRMIRKNGRTTQWKRLRWGIPLRAAAEGDYDIPPLVVEIDGQTFETRSLRLRVVRDLEGEDLGFLELNPTPPRVVEGQPFSLEILFGWDEASKVNIADLLLPWWGDLPGAVELDGPSTGQSAKQVEGVTINGRTPILVEEIRPVTRDGRKYRTLRLVKSFVPGRPGTLEFPTSYLEFGEQIAARSLFENSRKKTYFVKAPALSVEVVPLPTENQPYDYSGAVGTLEARASADTRDLVEGDSVKLEVVWTGSGNLEYFEPPDLALLDAFREFRVYGKTEDKSFERRRVVYDLAALTADVTEIPSVPLSVFDPGEMKYSVVKTNPIPIRVRPLEGRVVLDTEDGPRFVRDIRDIDTAPLQTAATNGEGGPTDGMLVILTLAVPAIWLVTRSVVRKRNGDPDAPLERRRRRARKRLARDLAAAKLPEEKLSALTAFLAAGTKEQEQAWVGRNPKDWIEAHGGSSETSEPVATVVERLEAAVYGSGKVDVPDAEILAAADSWQRAAREALAA